MRILLNNVGVLLELYKAECCYAVRFIFIHWICRTSTQEHNQLSMWEESNKLSILEESNKLSMWEESNKLIMWEESNKLSVWEESNKLCVGGVQ